MFQLSFELPINFLVKVSKNERQNWVNSNVDNANIYLELKKLKKGKKYSTTIH